MVEADDLNYDEEIRQKIAKHVETFKGYKKSLLLELYVNWLMKKAMIAKLKEKKD